MAANANTIACRICDKVFPHAALLLYHFDYVHGREGYTLVIQRNGSPVSRQTHFKLDSRQGNSQISSKRNGHAIFRSKVDYIRGQVNKEMEMDPVDFTEPLIKKLDKPFCFGNVAEDRDQNLDLELKL